MYYDKLRISSQQMWRVLTLTMFSILVYQNGPTLIHRLHCLNTTQEQIQGWKIMHELIISSPNDYPKSQEVCEVWLSAHGVTIPGKKGMKGLGEKWSNIIDYWRAYP